MAAFCARGGAEPGKTPIPASMDVINGTVGSFNMERRRRWSGMTGPGWLRAAEMSGAGNGVRTRDPQLGKLMLYQLSYSRLQAANVMAAAVSWRRVRH